MITDDPFEIDLILAYRRMTPTQRQALEETINDLVDLAAFDRIAKRYRLYPLKSSEPPVI